MVCDLSCFGQYRLLCHSARHIISHFRDCAHRICPFYAIADRIIGIAFTIASGICLPDQSAMDIICISDPVTKGICLFGQISCLVINIAFGISVLISHRT